MKELGFYKFRCFRVIKRVHQIQVIKIEKQSVFLQQKIKKKNDRINYFINCQKKFIFFASFVIESIYIRIM